MSVDIQTAQLADRHAAEMAQYLQARRLIHQQIMDAAWGEILQSLPPPGIPASVNRNACRSISDEEEDGSDDGGGGGPPGGGCRTRSPTPVEESDATPSGHCDALSEDAIRRRASNSGPASVNASDVRNFFQHAYDADDGDQSGASPAQLVDEAEAQHLTKEQLIAKFKELYSPEM